MKTFLQTYQREPRKPTETHAEHVGRIVGEVAPSMLLSSVAESTCFFLGALSDMPAVRAFALYAGMALFIDFFMQITCFIALIALDMARQENNRSVFLITVKSLLLPSERTDNYHIMAQTGSYHRHPVSETSTAAEGTGPGT